MPYPRGFPGGCLEMPCWRGFRRCLSVNAAPRFLRRRAQRAFDQADPVGDAERNRRVVEIVARIVERIRAGAPGLVAIAQPDVAARLLAQHVGEILRAHRWRNVRAHIVAAYRARRGALTERRFGGMVDRRRIAFIETHRHRCVKSLRQAR